MLFGEKLWYVTCISIHHEFHNMTLSKSLWIKIVTILKGLMRSYSKNYKEFNYNVVFCCKHLTEIWQFALTPSPQTPPPQEKVAWNVKHYFGKLTLLLHSLNYIFIPTNTTDTLSWFLIPLLQCSNAFQFFNVEFCLLEILFSKRKDDGYLEVHVSPGQTVQLVRASS